MDRGKSGPGRKGEMQRGDVAEPDQQLGIGADDLPVEKGEDTRAAPAAAHGKDGTHLGIGEHRVEVGGALPVGAREITVAHPDMGTQPGDQPHPPDGVLGRLDLRRIVAETGRLDQSDRVAGLQPRRQA